MSDLVIRQRVEPGLQYGEYRDCLREDFWYSCAYCTTTEIEATGVSFEIDHYEPVTAAPELEHTYSNLMWSCKHCNGLKLDLCLPTTAREAGYRFLRPDQDDFKDHLQLTGVRIEGTTDAGRCTVEFLDLNRQSLRRIRAAREQIHASRDHIMRGLQALRRVSPEQLPRELRLKFLELRKRLISEHEERLITAEEAIIALAIRSLQRSPLIDVDPEAATRKSARAATLHRLRALHPGNFRGREYKKER